MRRSFSRSSLHRELLILISSCGARHNETVVQELIALERPKSEPVIFDFTVGRQSVLAWMFDESPAVTADMTVLSGFLGCSFDRLRTSSPCDVAFRYASGPIPRYRGTVARWHAHLRGLATAIHEISGLGKGKVWQI